MINDAPFRDTDDEGLGDSATIRDQVLTFEPFSASAKKEDLKSPLPIFCSQLNTLTKKMLKQRNA